MKDIVGEQPTTRRKTHLADMSRKEQKGDAKVTVSY